jgi:ketosteroid isomerase-like protein
MRGIRLLQVAAVATAICACAPAGSASKGADSTTMAADQAALNKVRDDFAADFKAGDAAALAALYTSDGLSQGNMQPTATGTDAITTAYKGTFDPYTIVSMSLTPVKSEISGNLAYDIGTFSFVGVPKTKGDTLKASGRYMVVLRKLPDGTWKAVADMDNLSAPPPMPPAKK